MPLRFPRQEDEVQARLVAELRAAGLRFCHVPNEGKVSRRAATLRAAAGVESGVPDLLIFTPPPLFPSCVGAAIELKIKPHRPTAEQLQWLRDLYSVRWAVDLVSGVDAQDAIRLGLHRLRSWGYL